MAELKVGAEYYYEGDILTYVEDVKSMDGWCVVDEGGDYGYMRVVRKKDLIPKEQSWQWQQKQKYADELRLVTAKTEENFEKITEKVIKTACNALSMRMKMNVLFKSGLGDTGWAVAIAEELNKLVREEAPGVIKKEASEKN